MIGLSADHPSGWMAAVGIAGWSETTLGWDGDRAVLEIDADEVVDVAQVAAAVWLDSSFASMTTLPLEVDAFRHFRSTLAPWERDLLGRMADIEFDPRVIERVAKKRRSRVSEADMFRVHRSALVTFGVAQQTSLGVAARLARRVLDTPDLIGEALHTAPQRQVVTGLRWTGHPGLDWLAWMGLSWTPWPSRRVMYDALGRSWAEDVLLRPMWTAPVSAETILGWGRRISWRVWPGDAMMRSCWSDYLTIDRPYKYVTRTWSLSNRPELIVD